MDSERSQAYGRVVKTLEQTGKGALTVEEKQTVRTAADALLFDGGDAYDELAAVEDLVQQLVDDGRWTAAGGRRFVDDVAGCGSSVSTR